MPACKDCRWLRGDVCHQHDPNLKSLTRACVSALARSYVRLVRSGDLILEVGFGVWYGTRRLVRKQGGTWQGVDPKRYSEHRPGSISGSAAHMPDTPDNTYDGCFAFETMEHWREFGETPVEGLRELHRVLKPGAWMIVTVPIHMHGSSEFVAGEVDTILAYFNPFLWNFRAEEWRRDYAPLPKFTAWDRWNDKLVRTFSKDQDPVTWLLAIHATKKRS